MKAQANSVQRAEKVGTGIDRNLFRRPAGR